MNERRKGHIGRWHLGRWHLLAMLVLVLALGTSAGSALAGRLTDTAAGLPYVHEAAPPPPGSSSGVSGAPSSSNSTSSTSRAQNDARTQLASIGSSPAVSDSFI